MSAPFLLAPMAELSHRALRELIEEFGGCDEYFTEMISAAALFGGGPFEKWYMDGGPCPEKLVYQLLGSDIEQIVKAAALLDTLECAGIDLNMGCSAPLIRKAGAGVAWMASIDRAGDLVKEVRKVVKRRLSVKMRTGFTDDFAYLVRFCRRLEAEGVDLIILHPRTAREKFKRSARWSYIAALRQELQIPVAGNGDITSAEGLITLAGGGETGPCDAVMVGRAAVRQPWIFAQAKRIGSREWPEKVTDTIIKETGLRFLELLARWQPPEFHISRARRFFSYFCDNLKWGTHLQNLLNREETLSGMERVWQEYFNSE
ncbi:MAG: tRNA-dihydrouridine synthase family protein [Treponema sp.]|nr:tRNA-dihydrouridine synthase family protein [Treponema sp.]